MFRIDTARGFYPIVYVRGFAASAGEREETFYDTYYGYAATSVEKRNGVPPNYLRPIVFEGQLIRFLKEYGYVDAANGGLALAISNAGGLQHNPTRSLWISRFYDIDVLSEQVRPIEEHAKELKDLICKTIPEELKQIEGVDLGAGEKDYRVILIAHSMGGLVARCLIQTVLPDPKRWIHRFVTIGTPHGGIELSAVPDMLEELVAAKGNVFGSAIFKEDRMREYLSLPKGKKTKVPVNSLNGTYPEGRCLCIVGSDHESYNVTKKFTGSHSDGLVKQSNAYIEGAYWANVHRAHSGRRGIVNSFETYENLRRFLFGDTRVRIWLANLALKVEKGVGLKEELFDVEFSLSVRGTGIFLHQRRQNPCENAQRFKRAELEAMKGKPIHLHTGFLDTSLRAPGEMQFSHFLLAFRVSQHRVKDGFLFDTQYPERSIYSESMEARVTLAGQGTAKKPAVEYRWLSDVTNLEDPASWQKAVKSGEVFRFELRKADTLSGTLCVQPAPWPDGVTTEQTGMDAALA
jgi:PGAP1-like protein